MKILLVHNKYQQYGGEDATFEAEKNILESKNHIIKTLFFDNKDIDNLTKKLKLSYQLIYNRNSEKIIDEMIKDFKPDIIHVHNLFYLASPSILFAAYKNKIPVIMTLHNYRLICSGSLLMRDSKPCELCVNKMFPLDGIKYSCHRHSKIATAQLTLATGIHKLINTWDNKVSRYIAVTEFAKSKYINSSLSLSPEKIIVKPSSVLDVKPTDIQERENYFLFVGRLAEEKGIEVLLKAFDNKNVIIEIIGDGPLKNKVENVSANSSNIKYLAYREKSFIISRLKKCKALIVPSIWYEGLPTTILEAYSTGTPVIVSDIGNLNEIVLHNYNGLHFKTNDATDLYKVVKNFNENILQYQSLYSNARKTYLEKYTPEINYKNLINIYEATINTVV